MKGESILWLIMGVCITPLLLLVAFIWVPTLSTSIVHCSGNSCADEDAIRLAMQLGRLDIVSLCLTVFGVSVGIVAIYGFLRIRDNAMEVAKATADKVAAEYLEEALDTVRRQVTTEILADALSETDNILQVRGKQRDLGSPGYSQETDGTDNGGDIDETTSEEYNDEKQGE